MVGVRNELKDDLWVTRIFLCHAFHTYPTCLRWAFFPDLPLHGHGAHFLLIDERSPAGCQKDEQAPIAQVNGHGGEEHGSPVATYLAGSQPEQEDQQPTGHEDQRSRIDVGQQRVHSALGGCRVTA